MMRPPAPDPMTIPVLLRRRLLGEGWDDRAIRRRLASGDWLKVRHGAYLEAATWRALDEKGRHLVVTRCVLEHAKTEVVASHVSAAVLYGAPTWEVPLADVHVTRRDGHLGRHEAGVHQHCGRIAEGDVVVHRGVAVMSATRVALEITTALALDPAVGVVSHLLHTRRTTPEQLGERYTLAGNSMEHWPHSLRTDLVLRLASPKFESIGEVRSFLLMHRHGVPAPKLQHEVFDEVGNLIGRVDFAWPELGVFLEFDGRVKYEKYLKDGENAGDVVEREKLREREIMRVTGWRPIRLVWRDLDDPARTAAMILQFLFPGARAA